MWASCDQRCIEDSRLCYHAQYRSCPVATNSTLVHCTCRAHVDCVVNLKSGFATMIEFISSICAVVIVLMVTPSPLPLLTAPSTSYYRYARTVVVTVYSFVEGHSQLHSAP